MHPFIKIHTFVIPTYGLCLAAGILVCAFLTAINFKKYNKQPNAMCDLIIITAVTVGAAIIGGSVFYMAVTYSAKDILEYIKEGNFTFLTNSGLVFYGGLIGGLLGAVISAKILKIKLCTLEASAVPYIPIGHGIGRIGCLLAGCCRGFEYNGIFAVKNFSASPYLTYFPVQLLEALINILIAIVLIIYNRKTIASRKSYSLLVLYLFLYSAMRFILEFLRDDNIRGIYMGISSSQFISIFIWIGCMFFLLFRRIDKN